MGETQHFLLRKGGANVSCPEQEPPPPQSLPCTVGWGRGWGGREQGGIAAQPVTRCRRFPGGGDEAGSFPGYDLGPSASPGYLLQSLGKDEGKDRGEAPRSEHFPRVAGLVLGSHFPQ